MLWKKSWEVVRTIVIVFEHTRPHIDFVAISGKWLRNLSARTLFDRFLSVISVIVPTYNEGQRPLVLVTLLAETPRIAEVIIVDASDDVLSQRVLQQLQGHQTVRVIRATAQGRAKQMNQGAEVANGSILLFLHCDTLLPDDAIARIEDMLRSRYWGRFDLCLDRPGWPFRVIGFMVRLRSRLTRIATGDQAIYVRRDFFLMQGGFADIELMEDIEFSRRVGRWHRPGLITVPVTTSARRWVRHGILRTILLMWTLRLMYRLGFSPTQLARMYRTAR